MILKTSAQFHQHSFKTRHRLSMQGLAKDNRTPKNISSFNTIIHCALPPTTHHPPPRGLWGSKFVSVPCELLKPTARSEVRRYFRHDQERFHCPLTRPTHVHKTLLCMLSKVKLLSRERVEESVHSSEMCETSTRAREARHRLHAHHVRCLTLFFQQCGLF